MQTSTRSGFPAGAGFVFFSWSGVTLTLFSHVSVSQDQDVGVTRARAWHWLCQGPHTSSTRGCLASSFSLHEWVRPVPGSELSHVTELQDPCDNPSLCYWSVRTRAGGGNLSMLSSFMVTDFNAKYRHVHLTKHFWETFYWPRKTIIASKIIFVCFVTLLKNVTKTSRSCLSPVCNNFPEEWTISLWLLNFTRIEWRGGRWF